MSAKNRQFSQSFSPEYKPIKSQNTASSSVLQLSADEENTISSIWQSYKRTIIYKAPHAIYQKRSSVVSLMIECHKIMKLPLQTLFLAVATFDKLLNTNYQLNQNYHEDNSSIYELGISCLYACQKLQKVRNYGISYWIKHLSPQFLSSIGYSNIILSNQNLRKNEAYILEITNYNLFTSTIFDILLTIWTLEPPSEKQFYFAQYMLEISLFTQIYYMQKKNIIYVNTPSSLSENGQIIDHQQSDYSQNLLYSIDIAVAVVSLSLHFFTNQTSSIDNLIKKIWKQLRQEQNIKQFQQKKKYIKQIANNIFEKSLNLQADPNCIGILTKYSRQANMAVSNLKFFKPNQSSPNFSINSQRQSINLLGKRSLSIPF